MKVTLGMQKTVHFRGYSIYLTYDTPAFALEPVWWWSVFRDENGHCLYDGGESQSYIEAINAARKMIDQHIERGAPDDDLCDHEDD